MIIICTTCVNCYMAIKFLQLLDTNDNSSTAFMRLLFVGVRTYLSFCACVRVVRVCACVSAYKLECLSDKPCNGIDTHQVVSTWRPTSELQPLALQAREIREINYLSAKQTATPMTMTLT